MPIEAMALGLARSLRQSTKSVVETFCVTPQ